jgi:hypothetical protein
MKSIDVHDLSEDEAQIIAAFVESLRERRRQAAKASHAVVTGAEAIPQALTFATWPLGVQGTLSREEIYDHL